MRHTRCTLTRCGRGPRAAAPSRRYAVGKRGGQRMKRLTIIATACVLAFLAVLASRVGAQETNTSERTFMTFSAPVELPGVTLEAGTYEFKLADTDARNIVQVMRKDSKEPIGQW